MKLSETTSFDARTVSDKRLIELVSESLPVSIDHDEMLESLKLLRKDSSATVPMMKRLVSTGTPKARAMAAALVRRNCHFITEARKWEDRDPDWKYRVELVWDPNGAPELLRRWVLGNVLDETGGIHEEALLVAGVDTAAHGIKSSGFPSALETGTEAYWRGLSALYLSKVVHRNSKELRARAQAKARYDFYAQVDEFVEWAGTHPDINTVIDTARERKTIVVSDLLAVINQSGSAPAVASGAI